MKIRNMLLTVTLIFSLGIFIIFFILENTPDTKLDTAKVNDIVKTLSAHWEQMQSEPRLPVIDYDIDYAVIDCQGNLIAATRRGLSETINDAIRNRDTIVDITAGGTIVGKAIFYNDTPSIWAVYREKLIAESVCILILLAVICFGYAFYLNRVVLLPFNKLQAFARRIAAGNLDIPLEMDKNNLFGPFTESFDLMREELFKARENERKANQSKKELVASLSHDIKTPVASIKSVTELMLLKAAGEKEKKQLETVSAKSEQINSLITNMFHATLEELQELSVTVTEISSKMISALIQNADYDERVTPYSIPSCMVLADLLRLQQVFDNIIANSYKYAGTDIEIQASFDGRFLVIDITDYGPGVPEEEFPLLLNKFYRGKNAAKKSGYGLGLYISNYLMGRMSGDLQCQKHRDGFTIRLMIRLA